MRRYGLAFAFLFLGTVAHAEDDACITAFTQAQTLRKDGKPVAARAQAAICAQSTCNAILARDCTKWLAELEEIAPSIVFDVRNPKGAAVVDVRVMMDGEVLMTKIDGKAVELDPGPHAFVFDSAGFARAERTIVVHQGEKSRKHEIVLALGATPPPMRSTPTGVYVFGGASLVGLGLATVFTIDGLSRKSDLDTCKPRCAPDEIDAMSRSFTVADFALGAGVMAGATAVYLFLTRPQTTEPPRFGIMPTGITGVF